MATDAVKPCRGRMLFLCGSSTGTRPAPSACTWPKNYLATEQSRHRRIGRQVAYSPLIIGRELVMRPKQHIGIFLRRAVRDSARVSALGAERVGFRVVEHVGVQIGILLVAFRVQIKELRALATDLFPGFADAG